MIKERHCPECGGELREREARFPDCPDCGFEWLDGAAISLREETRREFEQAKRECWPDPVPPYKEYVKRAGPAGGEIA